MKYTRFLCLVLALWLLTGCSSIGNSYVSVKPHQEQDSNTVSGVVSVSSYAQLRSALEEMVLSATESSVINVSGYDETALESGMSMASRYICDTYPIGAFAVEELHYDVGSNRGKPAVAVDITYKRSRTEIQKIRSARDMQEAAQTLCAAMDGHDASLVLLVEEFQDMDFAQLAQDYAEGNPQSVMETPQVSVGIYGSGSTRVAEFTLTYQNSRDDLRQMKDQVSPVFASASLYVSGDAVDSQKYSQLYAFLMERFDYTLETSITPAYSLLCHGVGDSRAFATVYAAMCRLAGLECLTVTGTHEGAPRTWNIICINGVYSHVDLLRCSEAGQFHGWADGEMEGYVWDYSAFPACGGMTEEADIPEETEIPEGTLPEEPEQEPPETQPTAPPETQPTTPPETQPTTPPETQPEEPTEAPTEETTEPPTEETTENTEISNAPSQNP